jgi:hypothetical protein
VLLGAFPASGIVRSQFDGVPVGVVVIEGDRHPVIQTYKWGDPEPTQPHVAVHEVVKRRVLEREVIDAAVADLVRIASNANITILKPVRVISTPASVLDRYDPSLNHDSGLTAGRRSSFSVS